MDDYLDKSREYLDAGDSVVDDEAIACYLAGINAALIAIAERLDKSARPQQSPSKSCEHGLPTGCCAVCAQRPEMI